MSFSLQPMRVETGADAEEGCLVLWDGKLAAVLVRLSEQHGDAAGQWFFEQGFGRLDGPEHPSFEDLAAAQDWIRRRLHRRVACPL